jgi:hypothetical protein
MAHNRGRFPSRWSAVDAGSTGSNHPLLHLETHGALGIEPGHLRCWPFEKLLPLSALALLVGPVAVCL